MAKRKMTSNTPVTGGVRKRRSSGPSVAQRGNNTIVKYHVVGSTVSSDVNGTASTARKFVPGYAVGLSNSVGPSVASYYSTGKFLPGTKVRWEPSVSFTTPGRIFVGFTDNPEVMTAFDGMTITQALAAVKGLDSVRSFPVWQETEIAFPTALRRKRFDTNSSISASADVFDRSCQQYMLICAEGCSASTVLGSFWYHDVLELEGLQPVVT